jgi:hypothetical protein
MGILERNHYFNVQQHNRVCELGDDFLWHANDIIGFGGLNLFF